MKKLISALWTLGLIAILVSCPAPSSNSGAGGSNKPFEVSLDGLNRTAWEMINKEDVERRSVIIFEKYGNALKVFIGYNNYGVKDLTEAIADLALQKILGIEPEYSITKFVDKDAYIEEIPDGAIFCRFENEQKGEFLTILQDTTLLDQSYDLQRIDYPNFYSKVPTLNKDILNGQKWVYFSGGFPPFPIPSYSFPMVFERVNDEIKVHFSSKGESTFSSAEDAFNSIDTSGNSGTVTEINNTGHFIVIEWKDTSGKQHKWKLGYADTNHTGTLYLSQFNFGDDTPLPNDAYLYVFTRYQK